LSMTGHLKWVRMRLLAEQAHNPLGCFIYSRPRRVSRRFSTGGEPVAIGDPHAAKKDASALIEVRRTFDPGR
jgi:hypothetical protein